MQESTSFRESARFPAWKHLEGVDPGGPPPGDAPGNTVMAGAPSHWLKKRSAQIQKQWLYSGDTQVFFIKIMLMSLFSPGAWQSFFSTITQSAGHRSVYLHCVWKVHTLKSIEVTDNLDGSRSQDSWLPKNYQVYPGSPWRIHWKGVISVVREAVLSVRRDAASAAWRCAAFSGFRGQNDDGKGPQPML